MCLFPCLTIAIRRDRKFSFRLSLEDSANLQEFDTTQNSDLPFFDLSSIAAATDNFSAANKLGQGGFGSVYKGQLSNGMEIAVKRLSKYSGQGIEEFKNEIWDLWREGRAMEIVDQSLGESCSDHEVQRCIQIGLLCVQDYAADRPSMSAVVFMLGGGLRNGER
ncbi:G-type lectin S-receptor serine/threonine-protein kinase [Spatholobus suberectus]|nr:G-type lectin S-receptor serine/threonine-protein kinase [Spatholobus suberectus]